jgi:hypothetical protein
MNEYERWVVEAACRFRDATSRDEDLAASVALIDAVDLMREMEEHEQATTEQEGTQPSDRRTADQT